MWKIDSDRMIDFLLGLLSTPSPTGYHRESNEYVRRAFAEFPALQLNELPKGTLCYLWPAGANVNNVAPRAVTAHTDTLGFLVRQIKNNGRLKLARLGGISWPGAENENVTVRTQGDQLHRGTLILENPSTHVNREAQSTTRNEETMEVRLDARTSSADETRALGIDVGNFVFLDPRVELLETGYIRSRFLDDKACVATLYAAILRPSQCRFDAHAGYLYPHQQLRGIRPWRLHWFAQQPGRADHSGYGGHWRGTGLR